MTTIQDGHTSLGSMWKGHIQLALRRQLVIKLSNNLLLLGLAKVIRRRTKNASHQKFTPVKKTNASLCR